MVRHRIVITGATSGAGLALAKRYINGNHIVVGCGRSKKIIDDLNSSYSKDGHMFKVVDIMDKKQVKSFADEVINTIGVPTFLINNAGVCYAPQSVLEMSTEQFENIIDINIKGTFYVTHSFLPSMVAAEEGIIINLSSGWGSHPGVNQSAYCCSKFGIEGFSKVLALELPSPMACIPLNPGPVNAQMLVAAAGETVAATMRSPEKWAEEVSDFILKLDRNSNGKTIIVPGA